MKLLTLKPHALQLWWNDQLASWALFFKRANRAISLYQASLALDASNIHAKSCLANLYLAQNKHSLALQLTTELTAQAPENPAFAFNLGFLLNEQDQLQQAEFAFNSAISLDPNHDRAWYGLALLYIKQNRLVEAQAALEKNTQLQPMSPYGWYQLAMVQLQLGHPKTAQKTLAHLRTFEPKFARGLASDLKRLTSEMVESSSGLPNHEKTN